MLPGTGRSNVRHVARAPHLHSEGHVMVTVTVTVTVAVTVGCVQSLWHKYFYMYGSFILDFFAVELQTEREPCKSSCHASVLKHFLRKRVAVTSSRAHDNTLWRLILCSNILCVLCVGGSFSAEGALATSAHCDSHIQWLYSIPARARVRARHASPRLSCGPGSRTGIAFSDHVESV